MYTVMVVQCQPWKSPIGMYSERKTIAWCPCRLLSTVETFGEKISADACSGKGDSRFAEDDKEMMMNI